jgi:hypothetical protein
MANFLACDAFPDGFDTPNYKLTVPVRSARFFNLYGGGGAGEVLKVAATQGKVWLDELTFDPGVLNAGGSMRAFRAIGLATGADSITATLPAGGAYSAPLAVEVVADTDGTGAALTAAFQESRALLQQAVNKLTDLSLVVGSMAMGLPMGLDADQEKLLGLVQKWLGTPSLKKPDGTALPVGERAAKLRETQGVISQAIALMNRNLGLKNSRGTDPTVMRSLRPPFGLAYPSTPDLGLELARSCFEFGGPVCRHDVVTHEFFHLLGVGHGEAPGEPPRPFAVRPLPSAQALNSSDHLAQLVAESTTGKCDACTRRGE